MSRETVDAATGEFLERRHAETNIARAHAAGQRLDKVCDIENAVTLLEVSMAQSATDDKQSWSTSRWRTTVPRSTGR